MKPVDKKASLSLSIYSSNLASIISIYNDAEPIREQKAKELLEGLKFQTWTDSEFEEFTHYESHFKWLLMHSLFIAGFSYFENYMRTVADTIELTNGNKIKLKDIRGNGDIDKYRKYVNLIGNVSAAREDTKEWQTILEFKEIRNAIVHKSGVIDRKLPKAIEHNIYFGPREHMIRIKNIKFLEDFVNTAIRYMEMLTNEIG